MKAPRTTVICLFALAANRLLAGNPCEELPVHDRNSLDITFNWASALANPRGDAVWVPQSQFQRPNETARCIWSVLESCRQTGARSYQCGERKLKRLEMPLLQATTIQPACEFVKSAESAYSRNTTAGTRARFCLASVRQGGGLACLETEHAVFEDGFKRGYVSDKTEKEDPWLFVTLLELAAPVHSRLLPWLESLPMKSKSGQMSLLRRLAIASHRKNYPEFLTLFREADPFTGGYLAKWAVYYFPNADWKTDFVKMRMPGKRQKDMLAMILFEQGRQYGAAEAKQAEATYCRK